MYRVKALIVLLCAAALATGCANNNHKSTTQAKSKSNYKATPTQMASGKNSTNNSSSISGGFAAAATTQPTGQNFNSLAGFWTMAMPKRHEQEATISATDATHISIQAGKSKALTGNYVQQGNYLLILTRDERLRTIAWKINSPDSITCVRGPDLPNGGMFYTGVTLVRAPDNDEATEADTSDIMP
jgi:hypothetical protein